MKHIGLADEVPVSFPNVDIMDAYIFPATSWSSGDGPDLMPLTPKFPNIEKMAEFCTRVFSWGRVEGTLTKLHNTLWEGLCLAMLRDVSGCPILISSLANNTCSQLPQPYPLHPPFGPSAVQKIHMRKLRQLSASFVSYRVSVSTTALDNGARRGCSNIVAPGSSLNATPGCSDSTGSEPSGQTCMVWVPGPILELALPALVEAYSTRMKGALATNFSPAPVRMSCSLLNNLLRSLLLASLSFASCCNPARTHFRDY
jgi:hypothetical protein